MIIGLCIIYLVPWQPFPWFMSHEWRVSRVILSFNPVTNEWIAWRTKNDIDYLKGCVQSSPRGVMILISFARWVSSPQISQMMDPAADRAGKLLPGETWVPRGPPTTPVTSSIIIISHHRFSATLKLFLPAPNRTLSTIHRIYGRGCRRSNVLSKGWKQEPPLDVSIHFNWPTLSYFLSEAHQFRIPNYSILKHSLEAFPKYLLMSPLLIRCTYNFINEICHPHSAWLCFEKHGKWSFTDECQHETAKKSKRCLIQVLKLLMHTFKFNYKTIMFIIPFMFIESWINVSEIQMGKRTLFCKYGNILSHNGGFGTFDLRAL